MPRKWLSSESVSSAVGITRSALRRRAKRQGWERREVPSPGGGRPAIEYAFDGLPEDVKEALARVEVERIREEQAAAELARKQQAKADHLQAERALAELATLSDSDRLIVDAKRWCLKAVDVYIRESGVGKTKGRKAFAALYNEDEIEVPEDVRTSLETVSASSLRRWQSEVARGGAIALAPNYGKRSERDYAAAITEDNELGRFVLGMLLQKGQTMSWKTLHQAAKSEMARGRLEGPIPSARTFQRYLKWLREERPSIWENLVHPHAARGRVMPAFGDRGESVTRVNQLWELDSTLADVRLRDPNSSEERFVRFNLLACVDIYTRRVRFLVSRRSRSVAIASLLRRCLLEWGVPQGVKMDNGKDYRSKHLSVALDELEIETSFCKPYAPYEKPFVERVIGTFQHGCFTLLPGYTGASVSDAEALRSRRKKTAAGEPPLQLGEVHLDATGFQAFADEWATLHYAHNEHSAIGTTPFKKASERGHTLERIRNERALDILLAKPVGSRRGLFKVNRKGIRYQPEHLRGTWWFTAPELVGWIGRDVLCREDMTDVGRLIVSDPATGEHICIAVEPQLQGHSKAEVARSSTSLYKQQQRELIRVAREAAKKHEAGDVLQGIREQRLADSGKLVGRIGSASTDYEVPALKGAAAAAEALMNRAKKNRTEPTEEDLAAADELAAKLQRQRDAEDAAREEELRQGEAVLLRMSKTTRLYRNDSEHYDDLMDRISAGHQPTAEETAFIERFESASGGFGAQANAG